MQSCVAESSTWSRRSWALRRKRREKLRSEELRSDAHRGPDGTSFAFRQKLEHDCFVWKHFPFVPADAGTQFLQQSLGLRVREDERNLMPRFNMNRSRSKEGLIPRLSVES